MAMYYYASKISAIACGTRCRQSVLQQSRGQRDRDKYELDVSNGTLIEDADDAYCGVVRGEAEPDEGGAIVSEADDVPHFDSNLETASATRYRRRHSAQLDGYDDIAELGFQKLQVSSSMATNSTRTTFTSGGSIISNNTSGGYALDQITNQYNDDDDTNVVQYDVPKNTFKHSTCDVNYESSVLGAGGIMYINGKIVSGPLDSLIEVLLPKNLLDFDKEFVFSFLLSSRLFLRPHELLGKLLSSVPDSESLESLVTLLAEWTNKFPYDYRDERMMSHVKHIVARCSNTCLEAIVSDILSALLNRLTDLEQHEINLSSCQTPSDKPEERELFDHATSLQYAQILCRLEKKLAKQVGPEEFLQTGSNVLLDKQKKWDQPSTLFGPPGAQDPKKTCNLETYLDWSARLRLFVCNEILQCAGIHDRSRTVELWSGVAQYCLLVGNYNSATAILETLESPAIARLKITWSKLQVTCQQLDCMQRHAEGHGDLWNKQSIVLNENHQHQYQTQQQQQQQQQYIKTNDHNQQKTDMPVVALLSTSSSTATTVTAATTETDTDTEVATATATSTAKSTTTKFNLPIEVVGKIITKHTSCSPSPTKSPINVQSTTTTTIDNNSNTSAVRNPHHKIMTTTTNDTPTTTATKPNDWVVIPVFADIVKLALVAREHCLQTLPNGHINIVAFERMSAIVGAFTKHMQAVKSTTEAPSGEYETFCRHMQKTSKLAESELMMASFNCEEPNNAEKLMYDLN